jgi:hypothetical protein
LGRSQPPHGTLVVAFCGKAELMMFRTFVTSYNAELSAERPERLETAGPATYFAKFLKIYFYQCFQRVIGRLRPCFRMLFAYR